MIDKVIIEQIQNVDEIVKSTFEGEIVSKTDDSIKIVYKNQGKLNNLIIKKLSEDRIMLGTLSHMNELIINRITDFKHTVEGYTFNLKSKMIAFTFSNDSIEIYYNLILDGNVISNNNLKIVFQNA
ncbi:MAG: hypothetical protein J1F32_00435 [Erysipelotrichales bacterium]|nr:hypothetical protein [Erysipelotrichales bacterium]